MSRGQVRGEASDRKFTVLVGSRARCSCGIPLCLHHLFVMLKVYCSLSLLRSYRTLTSSAKGSRRSSQDSRGRATLVQKQVGAGQAFGLCNPFTNISTFSMSRESAQALERVPATAVLCTLHLPPLTSETRMALGRLITPSPSTCVVGAYNTMFPINGSNGLPTD